MRICLKSKFYFNPISLLALFNFVLNFILVLGQSNWWEQKKKHKLADIDKQTFLHFASAGEDVDFEKILDPLLTTRVSGTKKNKNARKYIIRFMERLGWEVETDKFTDKTPRGSKKFENIIATVDPSVHRRLVLACHYDSMYTKENNFIGATDSAVPCAMLLHLAKVLEKQLKKHKKDKWKKVSLQFIFFDGEEAFNSWSATDSLYGSRHLAAKWEKKKYPPKNKDKTTMLNRMDVMVLLDLLGTNDCHLISFFESTFHWHKSMVEAEAKLKKYGLWTGDKSSTIFLPKNINGSVQDDHLPFLQRGVDIVHLIPPRFPKVWHKPSDNKDALDFTTIDDMNKVFRVFVARYLHLSAGS